MLKLLATKGLAAGAEIEVEDELEIGRAAEGSGRLAGDVEISRRHARIARQDDGGYAIEDLGSTNGTIVNGSTIDGPHVLSTGDTLVLGATTLVAELPAPATAVEAPAEAAAPVRIALEIEIDAEGGSATVRLDDGPESAVQLEHRDGAWRLAGR